MVKKIGIVALLLISALAIINRERIMSLFGEDTRTINKSEVKLLFREDPTLDALVNVLLENGVIASDKNFREYIVENDIDASNFAAGTAEPIPTFPSIIILILSVPFVAKLN